MSIKKILTLSTEQELALEVVKQIIVIRKDLNMRKGKMVAQGAHAAMQFLLENYEPGGRFHDIMLDDASVTWFATGATKVVVGIDSEAELQELVEKAKVAGIPVFPIVDQGRTEFGGVPTLTCAALGPTQADLLDPLTRQLKLL